MASAFCRAHSLLIRTPVHVSELAERVCKSPLTLVGVEGAPVISEVLQQEAEALAEVALPGASSGLLLVGPEGDFTKEELQGLIDAGARPVGLGQNRLRVETAALAMIAAVSIGAK